MKEGTFNYSSSRALALAGVSIVYVLLGWLITTFIHSGVVGGFISFVLWIVKFYLCLHLLKKFLQGYASVTPNAGNSDVLRCGLLISFLSALVYSGFYLVYVLYIVPDTMQQAFDIAISQYSSMLDSNSMSMLDKLQASLPTFYFFVNLVYCFIFGAVASLIMSRNIPPRNPFAGTQEPDEQNQQ